MSYNIRKQFRIDEEMQEKLSFICNHINLEESEAFREALKEWIGDQMWKLRVRGKLKKIFVEGE